MVSSTLHLVHFIGNSYTIWLAFLNLNHTHCRLSLSLDTTTVEGPTHRVVNAQPGDPTYSKLSFFLSILVDK